MAQVVDVGQLLDEQPFGWGQIRIILLCFLMLFLDGVDNQGISYVAPALGKAWHLEPGALKGVFTLGVAGVAFGALIVGPLADRFGRRPMVIGTVTYFSIMTLALSLASDTSELAMLRLLGGLGLGIVVPMAVVISNEYSPRGMRGTMVTLASCGYAIGAFSGGQLAALIVPIYGWQSVFYVGGTVPLLLVAAMLLWLPESVRLMALQPGTGERIARTLKSVNPALTFAPDTQFVVTERPDREFRVFQLFTEGRVAITLLLWAIFFMNTTVLNLLNNWLPTLVDTTGLPHPQALRVASMLQLGGLIGVISMGMLADRFGFFRVLAAAFLVGGIFVGLVGSVGTSAYVLAATIAVAGFCNVGAQITNAAMAATLYPTNIRSTGVNWAHGVARVLSMIFVYLGGTVQEQHWPLQDIFFIFAVPLLCASGLILVLNAVVKSATAPAEPVGVVAAKGS